MISSAIVGDSELWSFITNSPEASSISLFAARFKVLYSTEYRSYTLYIYNYVQNNDGYD